MSEETAGEITIDEALCLLFRHKAAGLFLYLDGNPIYIRQEELIAAMERGFGGSSLGYWLKKSHRSASELKDFSPDESIVLMEGASCRLVKAVDLKGAAAGEMHSWMDLPFPLIHRSAAGELSMNGVAENLFEGKIMPSSLFDQALKEREALYFVNDKPFLLRHLGYGYFTLEEIDEEVELAQEIIWWAAVGKALSERLEGQDVEVKRLPENFPLNGVDGELLLCSWGNTPLGYLLLKF